MMSGFLKAVPGMNRSVIYKTTDGKYLRFSGGTLTWRNHNPGNVHPGKISKKHNQIGVAYKFAVFPDYASGHNALIDVLKITYINYSIDEMMQKYAPPHENPTKKYIKFLYQVTGVKPGTKIKDFTSDQFVKLWQGIERMEGYHEGTVAEVFRITKVRTSHKEGIFSFCIRDEWITKKQCIEIAKKGLVDLEVCISRMGHVFLRTPPHSLFQSKLKDIIEKKRKETIPCV